MYTNDSRNGSMLYEKYLSLERKKTNHAYLVYSEAEVCYFLFP